VWALGIEFLDEIVESGSLLKAVPSWRTGGFFLQRQIHPSMAAIDGQRIAVLAIAELELDFEISTPEVVRGGTGR
jgi:hypothetical protein